MLLRTVGYVLSKVDSLRYDAYKDAIEKAWRNLCDLKPEPTIFWEFIDEERNNIVKEYEIRAGQNDTVYLGQNKLADYQYRINAGPFNGRDQRDVLKEAIEWWESYLSDIDNDANKQP